MQREFINKRASELKTELTDALAEVQGALEQYAIQPRGETYIRVSECLARAEAIRMELLGVELALASCDRAELTDLGTAVLEDHRLAS